MGAGGALTGVQRPALSHWGVSSPCGVPWRQGTQWFHIAAGTTKDPPHVARTVPPWGPQCSKHDGVEPSQPLYPFQGLNLPLKMGVLPSKRDCF